MRKKRRVKQCNFHCRFHWSGKMLPYTDSEISFYPSNYYIVNFSNKGGIIKIHCTVENDLLSAFSHILWHWQWWFWGTSFPTPQKKVTSALLLTFTLLNPCCCRILTMFTWLVISYKVSLQEGSRTLRLRDSPVCTAPLNATHGYGGSPRESETRGEGLALKRNTQQNLIMKMTATQLHN